METFNKIFPFIAISLAIFAAYRIFVKGPSGRKVEEDGKIAIFEEKCGGRFNFINCTAPLVRHALYEDFLVVSYLDRCFLLNFNEIIEAENLKGLMSKGVRYHHTNNEAPKKMIVWSKQSYKFMPILRARNVHTR